MSDCVVNCWPCWNLGSYFFEEGGVTDTVTSDCYLYMLENFLRPQLEHRELEERSVWCQQDGATGHTTRRSLQVIWEIFPDQLILFRGFVGLPTYSVDFTPCDFFVGLPQFTLVYSSTPYPWRPWVCCSGRDSRCSTQQCLSSLTTFKNPSEHI